jgi:hypothetical protein
VERSYPFIVREPPLAARPELRAALERAGVRRGAVSSLPFVGGDATAGSEAELQAAVVGRRQEVDLPRAIEASSYLHNLSERAVRGDLPRSAYEGLERFLADNPSGVWENSWVRFPHAHLSPAARAHLESDLRRDKARPAGSLRADAGRFFETQGGEPWVRLPVSYVLKLALVSAAERAGSPGLAAAAERLARCFSNDNTSPETTSFRVLGLSAGVQPVVREAAKRFLLTQLLALYANRRFGLERAGQAMLVFHSPLPPRRQRQLNELVSDAFYRELFISPCLSGWDRGEDKQAYMALCHQVLSRSQLNAVGKLREAGIVRNNLVVLPSTSNLSLANNGTHISLGSRRLTQLRRDGAFSAADEKLLGDLVTKVSEHFLPLFVGTYSAAPYRLGFADFHPERLLGFLPHELDFTHLRMLWRRWQGKAGLHVLGRPLTPFGPPWLDRLLARGLRLRGDLVPDFRLLDYPVALLSTASHPGLDGRQGNVEALKLDLEAMGVVDARMALYLPLRTRELTRHGFVGIEGRHYSQFETFEGDFGGAAQLQLLITTFAWKLIAEGRVTHERIPDDPEVESERRHLFFAPAMGVPTVYVRARTANRFLAEVLEGASGLRSSRRYPGYVRVETVALQRALLKMLRHEARDLVAALGAESLLEELETRLSNPTVGSAAGRLVAGILGGRRSSALTLEAETFNQAAERYYREGLREKQLAEAARLFVAELAEWQARAEDGPLRRAAAVLGEGGALAVRFRRGLAAAMAGLASEAELAELVQIVVATELEAGEAAHFEAKGGASWSATNTSTARRAAR